MKENKNFLIKESDLKSKLQDNEDDNLSKLVNLNPFQRLIYYLWDCFKFTFKILLILILVLSLYNIIDLYNIISIKEIILITIKQTIIVYSIMFMVLFFYFLIVEETIVGVFQDLLNNRKERLSNIIYTPIQLCGFLLIVFLFLFFKGDLFFSIFIEYIKEDITNIIGVIFLFTLFIIGILHILKFIFKSIYKPYKFFSDYIFFFCIFFNIIFYGGLLGYFINYEDISGNDSFFILPLIFLIVIDFVSFISKGVIINKLELLHILFPDEKINLIDLFITILVIILVFSLSHFYYKNNIFITISLCLLLNNKIYYILKLFKNFFLKNI